MLNKFSFLLIIFSFIICSNYTYKLSNSLNSKEEVIQNVFNILVSQDEEGFTKILLSREEHNSMFWNHVGDRFRNDPGMTADLAYNFMNTETVISKKELVNRFKNGKYKISNIQCSRVEEYRPFKLHLGCSFIATDDKNVSEKIGNIRTVIEYNGQFKLYHLRRD